MGPLVLPPQQLTYEGLESFLLDILKKAVFGRDCAKSCCTLDGEADGNKREKRIRESLRAKHTWRIAEGEAQP